MFIFSLALSLVFKREINFKIKKKITYNIYGLECNKYLNKYDNLATHWSLLISISKELNYISEIIKS